MKFSYLFLQPKTSLQSYQRFDTRFKIEFDPHEWNKNYKDHNAFTIHFIGHWKTSGDHKMIWNSQTRHVFNTDIFLFVYLFIFLALRSVTRFLLHIQSYLLGYFQKDLTINIDKHPRKSSKNKHSNSQFRYNLLSVSVLLKLADCDFEWRTFEIHIQEQPRFLKLWIWI